MSTMKEIAERCQIIEANHLVNINLIKICVDKYMNSVKNLAGSCLDETMRIYSRGFKMRFSFIMNIF